VALGVAGGYLLGRTKKMKLALMLGGMAAGRRAGGPGELLSRGTKLVEASPELSRLVGEVRGRLIEAGKGAAVALATRQVEALTDRVGQRVESLASGGVPKRAKAAQEPAPERPAEDEYDQDEAAQDEPAQDEPAQDEPAQDETAQDEPAQDEPAQDEPAQDEPARDDGSPAERDEEPAEERAARPRRTRAPAAKATAARSGRGNSASAPVKRTASGTDRAAGRKPARAARTRRGNGDG
jgi:outer membrane biosynthesis protein TonB